MAKLSMTHAVKHAHASAAAQARIAAMRLDMGLAEPAALEAGATVVCISGGEQR